VHKTTSTIPDPEINSLNESVALVHQGELLPPLQLCTEPSVDVPVRKKLLFAVRKKGPENLSTTELTTTLTLNNEAAKSTKETVITKESSSISNHNIADPSKSTIATNPSTSANMNVDIPIASTISTSNAMLNQNNESKPVLRGKNKFKLLRYVIITNSYSYYLSIYSNI
jgi:hypothetical protein